MLRQLVEYLYSELADSQLEQLTEENDISFDEQGQDSTDEDSDGNLPNGEDDLIIDDQAPLFED